MKKILFVCLGNICRSPAAEGTLTKLLVENKIENVIVDSAGTSNFHEGQWPDKRMIETAQKRGIKLPTKSRPIKPQDLADFDLILCMDESNLSNVLKIPEAQKYKEKIKLFLSYGSTYNLTEVPDPYYGTEKDFNNVLDIVYDGSLNLLKKEKF